MEKKPHSFFISLYYYSSVKHKVFRCCFLESPQLAEVEFSSHTPLDSLFGADAMSVTMGLVPTSLHTSEFTCKFCWVFFPPLNYISLTVAVSYSCR